MRFRNFSAALAIPALRGENLEHFAFVIDGAPQIVRLAIDPDENLVEVPSPPGIRSTMNASSPYLRSEHRTKPVPPVSNSLVANIDTAFEQQVFDLPQREWVSDVHHHREADYFG